MSRRVEIKTGLFGKRSVSYDCPRCTARLTSPEGDIGLNDTCPDCGTVFQVPGREEIDRLNKSQALISWEKQQAAEREREEKSREQERERQLAVEREKRRVAEDRERRESRKAEFTEASASTGKTKKCPYCAEEILSEANKCKHCGEFLTTALRKANAPAPATNANGGCGPILTIAFGIIAAVIILALL